MSTANWKKALSCATGASTFAIGVLMASSAQGTTLTNHQTTGADMTGMEITVNFLDGTSDTQSWSSTGVISGGAFGANWSLTQSGNTFFTPWTLGYTGLGSITSLTIDAIPGNAVFDTIATFDSPPDTPGSFLGKPFSVQSGLAPTSFNYSVPIDISQGDLFGTLSLFWGGGFTASDSLTFIADTDSGTINDPVTPKPTGVPEPSSLLGLLALGIFGAGSMPKGKHNV